MKQRTCLAWHPMTTSNTLQKLRRFLESRTGKAIGDYNMIEEGDTVLVCCSGGKI